MDNDGDGKVNEDGEGYYDPNRDWGWKWQPNYVQNGAYKYPFSLSENRNIRNFVMEHPNIAKVLDAGVNEWGRPYFAMELVKGIPITKFCDQEHLSPRERLDLFIQVCQGVQHAHQKGIIHRDIKPSNILVALYDGKPVPKIIDFGVAKATGQRITAKTVNTEIGSLLGTLEYMSPEQADLTNLDIDTRTDVYALGVILYELLTGTVPFTRDELAEAGMVEMLMGSRRRNPRNPVPRSPRSKNCPTSPLIADPIPPACGIFLKGNWIGSS